MRRRTFVELHNGFEKSVYGFPFSTTLELGYERYESEASGDHARAKKSAIAEMRDQHRTEQVVDLHTLLSLYILSGDIVQMIIKL